MDLIWDLWQIQESLSNQTLKNAHFYTWLKNGARLCLILKLRHNYWSNIHYRHLFFPKTCMKHEPAHPNVCHDLIPLFPLHVRHSIRGVTSQTERTWEDKASSANSCSNYTETFFYSEFRCLPPRQRAEDPVITGRGKHTCSHTLFSGSSGFLSKFCREHATQLRVKAALSRAANIRAKENPWIFWVLFEISCFLGLASELRAKLFQNSACTQTRQNSHRERAHMYNAAVSQFRWVCLTTWMSNHSGSL